MGKRQQPTQGTRRPVYQFGDIPELYIQKKSKFHIPYSDPMGLTILLSVICLVCVDKYMPRVINGHKID